MDEIPTESLITALQQAKSLSTDHVNVVLQELCNRAADERQSSLTTKTVYELFSCIFDFVKEFSTLHPSTLDLVLSLLCNATISEENCTLLLERNNQVGSSYHVLETLLDRFLDYYPQAEDKSCSDWTTSDPWQHVGSILCNLVRVKEARKLLLNPSCQYLQKLAVQIRSANIIRRRGAVGTLRSLLFDHVIHSWAISDCSILPHILIPLVVYKPFSAEEKKGMDPVLWIQAENEKKTTEQDKEITLMLLDCLLLLCQTKHVRQVLRQKKVYYICRNLDESTDDEDISNKIYEVVNFLARDEETQ